MMKLTDKCSFTNKAFLLGFLISLIGSLPIGYLNVIGLQILVERGHLAIASFILGIIAVEFFVLNVVSFGAKWLVKQKKLLLFIDVFTILFFTSIASYFINNISNDMNFEITSAIPEENHVAITWILTGTNLGMIGESSSNKKCN